MSDFGPQELGLAAASLRRSLEALQAKIGDGYAVTTRGAVIRAGDVEEAVNRLTVLEDMLGAATRAEASAVVSAIEQERRALAQRLTGEHFLRWSANRAIPLGPENGIGKFVADYLADLYQGLLGVPLE